MQMIAPVLACLAVQLDARIIESILTAGCRVDVRPHFQPNVAGLLRHAQNLMPPICRNPGFVLAVINIA